MLSGRHRRTMMAGCKLLVPLACSSTMKFQSAQSRHMTNRVSPLWRRESMMDSLSLLSSGRPWYVLLCPMTSTAGAADCSDCHGLDALLGRSQADSRQKFFVLCWCVAVPETAKPELPCCVETSDASETKACKGLASRNASCHNVHKRSHIRSHS